MLGVDPGTINMGYGVLDDSDAGPSLVSCGVLKAPSSRPIPERLHKLYNGLRELIEQYSPDEVAVEEPFVHKSVRSAMLIGQANAVALLAAAQAGSGVFQYSPRLVKMTVTGHGGSDKEQVREMISPPAGPGRVPRLPGRLRCRGRGPVPYPAKRSGADDRRERAGVGL